MFQVNSIGMPRFGESGNNDLGQPRTRMASTARARHQQFGPVISRRDKRRTARDNKQHNQLAIRLEKLVRRIQATGSETPNPNQLPSTTRMLRSGKTNIFFTPAHQLDVIKNFKTGERKTLQIPDTVVVKNVDGFGMRRGDVNYATFQRNAAGKFEFVGGRSALPPNPMATETSGDPNHFIVDKNTPGIWTQLRQLLANFRQEHQAKPKLEKAA